MTKLIPLLLTLVLTACGGGGGGGIAIQSTKDYSTVSGYMGFVPSLNTAHLTNDGSTHVVLSGWLQSNSTNSTTTAPIKIFRVNTDSLTDVTSEILGESVNWSVQYTVIADFNSDGIDDIFLPGFMDISPFSYKSAVYLSRRGQSHQKIEYSTATYNHAATAADIDADGDIDVISSSGHMWLNNGAGTFTYKAAGRGMNGNGVCVGDFNQSGRPQLLITDVYLDAQFSPISDSVIFQLDSNLNPVQTYTLPTPYFDRNNLGLTQTIFGVEYSHDVSCLVDDVNSDGLPDVLLISAYNGGTKQSRLQLYINQGNFVFSDATDSNIINYITATHSSYAPKLIDFNGDNKNDIWLMHFDWQSVNPNQLWTNNGSGTFTQTNSIINKINQFNTKTMADQNYIGPAVPVKLQNTWYLVTSSMTNGVVNLAVTTYF